MQSSTEKKRDAVFSALLYSVLFISAGAADLWIVHHWLLQGIARVLLIAAFVLDLGILIPIWISLKTRLNEIDGGEEDAAAQY